MIISEGGRLQIGSEVALMGSPWFGCGVVTASDEGTRKVRFFMGEVWCEERQLIQVAADAPANKEEDDD